MHEVESLKEYNRLNNFETIESSVMLIEEDSDDEIFNVLGESLNPEEKKQLNEMYAKFNL